MIPIDHNKASIRPKATPKVKAKQTGVGVNSEPDESDEFDESNISTSNNASLNESGKNNCPDPVRTSKPRKNYSIKQKLDMVNEYSRNEAGKGYKAIAKKHNVPITTFQKWVKQKDKLLEILQDPKVKSKECRRLPGGGRKPAFEEVESLAVDYMKNQNEKGIRITMPTLQVRLHFPLCNHLFSLVYFL